MDDLELALILDRVMDLKYGFDKNLYRLSGVTINYKEINKRFIDLFNFCRDGYKTKKLDKRIKEKIYSFFGENTNTENNIKTLLNLE